ncbi:hypothetical protein ABZ738_05330 [Micromonospora sp. NPDC047793]|uniref:hypothetical protein n=1 Tax=Micromonospora sp. NPDC047793 TaxID=3154342 RepID=UPI0033C1E5FD
MPHLSWDPSHPTSYTWEPGALDRTLMNSIEPYEVMQVLRGGSWWILELVRGVFQVVGRAGAGAVLTVFVTRQPAGDFDPDNQEPVVNMRVDGARRAEPFEEKYFLEVSGNGAGE